MYTGTPQLGTYFVVFALVLVVHLQLRRQGEREKSALEGGRRLLVVQPNLYTARAEEEMADDIKREGEKRVKGSGKYNCYPFNLTEENTDGNK